MARRHRKPRKRHREVVTSGGQTQDQAKDEGRPSGSTAPSASPRRWARRSIRCSRSVALPAATSSPIGQPWRRRPMTGGPARQAGLAARRTWRRGRGALSQLPPRPCAGAGATRASGSRRRSTAISAISSSARSGSAPTPFAGLARPPRRQRRQRLAGVTARAASPARSKGSADPGMRDALRELGQAMARRNRSALSSSHRMFIAG